MATSSNEPTLPRVTTIQPVTSEPDFELAPENKSSGNHIEYESLEFSDLLDQLSKITLKEFFPIEQNISGLPENQKSLDISPVQSAADNILEFSDDKVFHKNTIHSDHINKPVQQENTILSMSVMQQMNSPGS